MKDKLLLLMTPNMSLEKWHELGQLSRELNYYTALCRSSGLKLLIFSYGRDDEKYLKGHSGMEVLCIPGWISRKIPFRVQNLLYHVWALMFFREQFGRVVLSKTNQYSSSGFGLILKAIFGIPLVVRMGYYYSHFLGLGFVQRIKERIAFRLCDLIIVTSNEASAFIKKNYGISHEKILSMYNAIDLELFKPSGRQKEYDFIFIGRFEKQKNIGLLMQVLCGLNMKSLIIGKGSLSHVVQEALSRTQSMEWKESVDNSELPFYYNKARCVILLSEYEGSPKVLLEAMACGTPGIGTSVPGTRECIDHGVNGILVGNREADIRRDILSWFSDLNQLETMGHKASGWVRHHCDMTKNINREIEFYGILPLFRSFTMQINQKVPSC